MCESQALPRLLHQKLLKSQIDVLLLGFFSLIGFGLFFVIPKVEQICAQLRNIKLKFFGKLLVQHIQVLENLLKVLTGI